MEVKSTRQRHVESKDLFAIDAFITSLPFKVELKSLVVKSNKFYQTFVIPDNVADFLSVDLDQ